MSNSPNISTYRKRAFTTDPKALRLARCSSADARARVPYDLARTLEALPIGLLQTREGETLAVACPEARLSEVKTALRFSTGLLIRTVPAPVEQIQAALFVAYCGDSQILEDRLKALQTAEAAHSVPPRIERHYSDAEIPAFVRTLLRYAYAQRASDIHLSPSAMGTRLTIRVDGEMLERAEPIASIAQHEHLVRHIKVLASLDVTERSRPQDGVLQSCVSLEGPGSAASPIRGQVRVSCMPTEFGERVVLRLAGNGLIPNLDELGLLPQVIERLRAVLKESEGAILLSGSTGSGKTTTLYSIVRELSGQGFAVSSIEDPVEVTIEGVSQTSLNETKGLDYETGLRGALRQDPDAIMLGELRTAKSALTAIQAAMSGHLVLSTVHAASVFHVSTRLRLLGIDTDLVAQALRMALHQRLIPRLCAVCRVTDLRLSQRLGFEAYRPVGCNECAYRGISGRVLVAESLHLDESVREMLAGGMLDAVAKAQLAEGGQYVSDVLQIRAYAKEGLIAGGELERLL